MHYNISKTISQYKKYHSRNNYEKTPRVGLEPTTTRLTAECSTIELSRNKVHDIYLQNFIQNQCLSITIQFLTFDSKCSWSSPQTISNSQLHVLPHFHLCPIYLVLFKGFYFFKRMGYLILGGTSRLDAFSVYSFRTWLPGDAIGMTAGTPVVRPARSSRTKASSPQISYARAG